MKHDIKKINAAVQDSVMLALTVTAKAFDSDTATAELSKAIVFCDISAAIAELFNAYENEGEDKFSHTYLDTVLAIGTRCAEVYEALGGGKTVADKINEDPLKVSELTEELRMELAEVMGISIGEVHKHWDEYVVVVDGKAAFKEGK